MARTFSVVPVELSAGVDAERFERFYVQQYIPFGERLGWKGYLLVGDYGERAGRYTLLWDKGPVEERDRLCPPPERHFTEEAYRILGPNSAADLKALNDRLTTFVTVASTNYSQVVK
jgi:hypothetical protein